MSKTNDDFPDPDTPVNTTNRLRGIRSDTFFRLLTRALRTSMYPCAAAFASVAMKATLEGARPAP